jgi:demethylmenaquinone methyltransferase/2-methoxy-6-polyprenyl-1,4-benzoquinol methylase
MTTVPDKSPERITKMFDAIAPRYDLLNRALSLGIDRGWRQQAIASLDLDGSQTLLDVCTGTADMALEGRRCGGAARVIGVDFAGAMLALGRRKVSAVGEQSRIQLVRADASRLPVTGGCADAATVAFGIRNTEQPEIVCAEIVRALRPGGRLAIIEFGMPLVPVLRRLYHWYFDKLLPRVGRIISGHANAYTYLPASVESFPPPEKFVTILQQAGFENVQAVPLTFGVVYLYTAVRS